MKEEPGAPVAHKVKVVILGGGCGAMSAACHLTSTPELRDKYDITVYQQGWRIGGKGATGRDPRQGYGDRIYEHGLHMWLGWYHNAFAMIQGVYSEWEKDPKNPFQSWTDAFEPQRLYTLQQDVPKALGGIEWRRRNFPMPKLPGTPGQGETLLEMGEFLSRLIQNTESIFREHSPFHPHRDKNLSDALVADPAHLETAAKVETGIAPGDRAHGEAHRFLVPALHGAVRIRNAAKWRDDGGEIRNPDPLSPEEHSRILGMIEHFLEGFQHWIHLPLIEAMKSVSATYRWYWNLLDMLAAIGLGMIREVIPQGVASINDSEFHEWVKKHGAAVDTSWFAGMRAVYDLAFAFEGGRASATDPATARFEAGTALMVLLRIGLGYKDAPMFRMMAGMGDTVFAPIYEVLKKRGVKFAFFHRATNLSLSGDKKQIDAIEFDVQADVIGGYTAYDPLFDLTFKDGSVLPVWPEEPNWTKLNQGDALRERLQAAGQTLDSAWCDEKITTRNITNGIDFDYVVLGISVAGVKMITPELAAASEDWKNMVNNLATVQTHAVQLWMQPALENLGWKDGATIQTTYEEPTDTWAVMTEVMKYEVWTGDNPPLSLHYFCGPLPGPAEPPLDDSIYPQTKRDEVRKNAMAWLDAHIAHLWPDAADRQGFNYDLIHDPDPGGSGRAKFDSQYWRANVDPSERYVNSYPGTTKYRLRSDQSGFMNLFLAGDWTISSVNGGCVEAAVESGMAASRGICGVPAKIPNYPGG